MDLKRHGVFMFNEGMSAPVLREHVQRIERLGYGAVWFPEAIGREPFATAAFILNHTETLIAATGIMNIYGRDPTVTAMGQQTLAEMSGGRFLLGLGVSHSFFVEARGHTYGKPLGAMREYLAALRQCHTGISITRNLAVEGFAPQTVGRGALGAITTELGELPVVIAALGPKMNARGRAGARLTPLQHHAGAHATLPRHSGPRGLAMPNAARVFDHRCAARPSGGAANSGDVSHPAQLPEHAHRLRLYRRRLRQRRQRPAHRPTAGLG